MGELSPPGAGIGDEPVLGITLSAERPPLGLPEGSVRAIIALLIVCGTLGCLLVYKWAPEALTSLCSLVVGYYYGARNQGPTK